MSRPLEFRAWSDKHKDFYFCTINSLPYEPVTISKPLESGLFGIDLPTSYSLQWEQYTGLKDKNGTKIFELCELNNRYTVIYRAPKFVLIENITGDIIDLYESNKWEITREHSSVQENS